MHKAVCVPSSMGTFLPIYLFLARSTGKMAIKRGLFDFKEAFGFPK